MHLNNNVPGWERIVRIVLGLGKVVASVIWAASGGWFGWVTAVGGLVLAATGVIGWCPLCAMVGRKLPKVERTVSIERL